MFVTVATTMRESPARARTVEVFSIGVKNNSFTEFARDREAERAILFKVGESSAERDWPAYQPGSFDSSVGFSTMQQDGVEVKPNPAPDPFQVRFNLPAAPRGTFVLHLDAIFRYRRPAPDPAHRGRRPRGHAHRPGGPLARLRGRRRGRSALIRQS